MISKKAILAIVGIIFIANGSVEFVHADSSFNANRELLIKNIDNYASEYFNENYKIMAKSFDKNNDDYLDSDELWYALQELNIGTYVTRTLWVSGIIDYFKEHPTNNNENNKKKMINNIMNTKNNNIMKNSVYLSDFLNLAMYSSGTN